MKNESRVLLGPYHQCGPADFTYQNGEQKPAPHGGNLSVKTTNGLILEELFFALSTRDNRGLIIQSVVIYSSGSSEGPYFIDSREDPFLCSKNNILVWILMDYSFPHRTMHKFSMTWENNGLGYFFYHTVLQDTARVLSNTFLGF